MVSDSERFVSVEEAALRLGLSPRKLKALLAENGYGVYSFGSRTKRIRESDLRKVIATAATQ